MGSLLHLKAPGSKFCSFPEVQAAVIATGHYYTPPPHVSHAHFPFKGLLLPSSQHSSPRGTHAKPQLLSPCFDLPPKRSSGKDPVRAPAHTL